MMAMFLVSNQQDKVYTKMNLEAWAITTSNPETPLWPQTKHLYIYIWFYCKQQKNGGNSYQPILSARFFFNVGTKNPNFSFSKQVLGKKWSLLPPEIYSENFSTTNFHKKQKQHKSIPTYKSKTPNSRNIIFNWFLPFTASKSTQEIKGKT